jgi:hypothetical protein
VIIYHTGGNEFGGSINTGTKRVAGIEYLKFDTSISAWSIPQIDKTFRGVGIPYSFDTIQVDRHSPKGLSGAQVKVVNGNEPEGWMVTNISNDGYIQYDDVDFSLTDKTSGDISIRVASASTGGSVEIREGTTDGILLCTVSIPSTGGKTTWKTVTAPISSEGLKINGVKNIKLIFKTTSANQFSINWISIGKQKSTGLYELPELHYSQTTQQFSLQAIDMQVNIFNLKEQKISRYSYSHEKSIIFRNDYNGTHFFVPGVYVSNR